MMAWIRAKVPRLPLFIVLLLSWFCNRAFKPKERYKGFFDNVVRSKQFNKCLCCNKLVIGKWCTQIGRIYLILFLNNSIYFIIRCVYILGTKQLLKSWCHIGHCHPHFLFHIYFSAILAFFTITTSKNSFSKITIKGIQWCSVEAVNYIKWVLHSVLTNCPVALWLQCGNFRIRVKSG